MVDLLNVNRRSTEIPFPFIYLLYFIYYYIFIYIYIFYLFIYFYTFFTRSGLPRLVWGEGGGGGADAPVATPWLRTCKYNIRLQLPCSLACLISLALKSDKSVFVESTADSHIYSVSFFQSSLHGLQNSLELKLPPSRIHVFQHVFPNLF